MISLIILKFITSTRQLMSSQNEVNLFAAVRLFKQCKHEMAEEYFHSELQELAGNLKKGRLLYQPKCRYEDGHGMQPLLYQRHQQS